LDRKVTGVDGAFVRVTSEGHDDRPSERETDTLEDVEVKGRDAALDSAHHHPTDAGAVGQGGAGHSAPFPARADLDAEAEALLAHPPFVLDREDGPPDPGHDRHMFIQGTSPVVTRPRPARTASKGPPVLERCARSKTRLASVRLGRLGGRSETTE
jgi:hypothetical protein